MKFLAISFSSLILMACTTGPKSTSKKAKVYTEYVESKSVDRLKRSMAAKCPSSKRSWKSLPWKQQMGLANACVKAKKWSKLEEIANNLAKKEHLSPWGSYYLSIAALSKGNLDRALWMIQLAIKKAPKEAILAYQKGRIQWAMKAYDQSVAAFQLALKLDSKLIDAHYFLGQVYFRDQNYDKAIDHFEEVVERDSFNSVALMGLADSYAQLNKADKAVDYFKQAIDQMPRHLGLRLKLAEIYERQQNDLKSALKTYKRIRELKKQRRLKGQLTMNIDNKIKNLEATLNKAEVRS